MDEFCLDESCFQSRKRAKYGCSCDLTLRFCSKHMLSHHKIPGAHNEIDLSVVIKELHLKAASALENLDENQVKVLNAGQLMTKEIFIKIQDTMMLLESRKIEILDILKSRQFGENIDSKIEEINEISFQQKEGFQESIQKYLELYENYENSIFKEEIISIHKSIEASNALFKEISEIISKENNNFMNKFKDLENKVNENILAIKYDISININKKLITEIENTKNREQLISEEINKIKNQFSVETENNKDNKRQINEEINKIKNQLSVETENNKDNKRQINDEINKIKQEYNEKLKAQEIIFNENNQKAVAESREEILKQKLTFETLINDNAKLIANSILKMQQELLSKIKEESSEIYRTISDVLNNPSIMRIESDNEA